MIGGASPSPASADGARAAGARLDAVLTRCDALFGEIGRRQHRFAWLRAPGATDWVVVDAYYPGNRVVLCLGLDEEERGLCLTLGPQHGLYVVTSDPAELPADPEAAAQSLRGQLEHDGWTPRPAPLVAAPVGLPEPLRPMTAAAQTGAARTVSSRVGGPRSGPARAVALPDGAEGGSAGPPGAGSGQRGAGASAAAARPRPAGQEERFGLWIGVVLIVVVAVEAYLGMVKIGFGDGDIILGFGLLLDACARVAGTISAGHAGNHEDAFTSLVIGSPGLASLTPEQVEGNEPARLARMIALAAVSVTGLGIVLAIL